MAIDPVSLAITVALDALSMALAASRRIEGPRLSDLSASVADYGTPLNYLYGIRRLECACFYCEPIREKKSTQKGKTGKYSSYTYFGTFAIIVADQRISGYSRIWFDRHLVYDATGSGGEITNPTDHTTLSTYMRQYLGKPDQSPDPRMVAYITNKEGADLTPAYLDIAYLMFEGLPLEVLGNRFPQVSVEAEAQPSGSGTGNFEVAKLSDTADFNVDSFSQSYFSPILFSSPSGNFILGGNYYDTSWLVDTSPAAPGPPVRIYEDVWYGTVPPDFDPGTGIQPFAVDDEGSVWGGDSNADGILYEIPNDPTHKPLASYVWTDAGGNAQGLFVEWVWTFTMPDGSIFLVLRPGSDFPGLNPLFFTATKGVAGLTERTGPNGHSCDWAFQDDHGDVWIIGVPYALSGAGGVGSMSVERITNVTGSSPYPAGPLEFVMPVVDASEGGTLPSIVTHISPFGFFSGGCVVGGWQDEHSDPTVGDTRWLYRAHLDGSGTVLIRDLGASRVWGFYQQLAANPNSFFVGVPTGILATGHLTRRLQQISQTDLTDGAVYNLDQWVAGDAGDDAFGNDATVYSNIYLDGVQAFAGDRTIQLDEDAFLYQSDLFVYYIPTTVDLNLGFICGDVVKRAGLAEAEFDFSDLDQPIPGYSWTIGQGRDIVGPLLDIYDSDIFPNGFHLSGRKRGGVDDGAVIETEMLVRESRSAPSSTRQPLFKIIMEAESDLTRRIFATFADTTADQQPNTAVSQRNIASTVTTRETPVDLTTLALSPDEAQPLADRWLRRRWIGSTTYSYTASPAEMKLTPADVRVSNLDGQLLRGRLTRLTIKADRSLQCEWEVDSAITAALKASEGASQLGRPPSVIFSPIQSETFALDIPLVSDADDQTSPFFYIAAGRTTADGTWPGADFQHNDTDAADTWESGWDAIISANEAVWGECEGVLGDALPWIPDRRNTLVVNIPQGSLESHEDEYLNAHPTANLAAIGTHATGWEIVQFGVATLQSARQWELSNFYRRGVKGTEALIPGHLAGEQFVLLQNLTKHTLGAGEIGDTDYYRAVTITLDEADSGEVAVDFVAKAHRPLSPVHVKLSRNLATNDWTGTFVRRSRIGGGSVNGQDVPLGESLESYRVKIMNGATVVRTIAVSSAAFTYLAPDQVTDWGSHQTGLAVEICQMDPTLNIEGAATSASA